MFRWKKAIWAVGQAAYAKGFRALAGLVPFGEVVYDIAADALERLRDGTEEEARVSLEEMAQVPIEEVRREAEKVVLVLAAGQPDGVREQLTGLLLQMPASVRQSFRRPPTRSARHRRRV